MKRLSVVEAWLGRKRRLEQMKKELDDQKWRIRKMIGKTILPKKASDQELNPKIKNISQVKSSSGAKPKTGEAISKLKVPVSATDVGI